MLSSNQMTSPKSVPENDHPHKQMSDKKGKKNPHFKEERPNNSFHHKKENVNTSNLEKSRGKK